MFKLSSKIVKKPPAKFVAGRAFKILTAILGIAVVATVGFLIVRANPDYVSDPFTDETKIGGGTTKVEIATTTGQVKLAEIGRAHV